MAAVHWEHTHRGWVAAVLITNAAMRALLLNGRLTDVEHDERLRPWRQLVGDPAADLALATSNEALDPLWAGW